MQQSEYSSNDPQSHPFAKVFLFLIILNLPT